MRTRHDAAGAVKGWALWTAPRRVVVLVVLIETVTAWLCAAAISADSITGADLLRFGLLVLLSVAYLEGTRQVEHRRRLFADAAGYTNMSSVWALAGAIVLPPALAVALALLMYGHFWLRSWRSVDGIRAHRVGYSASTVVLSCLAVATALSATEATRDQWAGGTALGAVIAVCTYRVVNRSLISAAILLSSGGYARAKLFGTWSENRVEFATLALGTMTATSVLRVPWFAVMVLPAVFLLQYHALLRDLVQAATVDAKTELLNASAWRQLAQRELTRAERQRTSTAVLVIDMDRFKQINDTYGHLAGDAALKTVADALADELREYDAVGRFGGEEFVALLPAAEAPAAQQVAERLRRRIESTEIAVQGRDGPRRIHVTASVGVAAGSAGSELDDLLHAADQALYLAKHEGRNAVRVAEAPIAA